MLDNKDSDFWVNRTLSFLKVLNNAIKNIEIEKEFSLSRYLSLDNIVDLYKKTGNSGIEDYLICLPGFPFKNNKLDIEDFESKKNTNDRSYNKQHGYLIMPVVYDKNLKGVMINLNNYEVFIYLDKIKSMYCLSYIGEKSYFNDIYELISVVKLIKNEKIITVNEFKMAKILVY